MTPRTAWRWCAAAGVVAFLCSWLFGRIPGLVACGPTGGLGPIIAFELARAPAEVTALFGGEPCRSTLVAAQKTGLLLDGLGFIPAYTALLILGAVATGVRGRAGWALVGALAVAGLCDQIEGGLLYAILRHLPGDRPLIDALFWVVRVKFVLLGLGTLAIGILLLATRRAAAIVSGNAIGVGALIALRGLASPGMITGFAIAWAALLLTAAIGAFRPSSPARAAPPPARATPSA